MADFMDVLNQKASDVEKPKPRPAGTYLGTIIGMPDQVERKDNKMLEFKVKLMMAKDDVDREKLDEQPELSGWAPLKYTVFVNDPWPLKRFLTEVLEIDPGDESDPKTLGQMVAEAPGKQILATIQHRPYMTADNQPEISAEIKGVAKAS